MSLAALLALLVLPAAASAPADVKVERGEGGRYEITGSFEARADTATAFAVLSDYENIPRFVPSMESSRVLKRDPAETLVEQVSIGRALIFRRRMRLVLKVEERASREILFEDLSGTSFRLYRGSWTVDAGPAGSTVTYRLSATGAFAAPGFLANGAARRMVRELLDGVRREMEGRAAGARL